MCTISKSAIIADTVIIHNNVTIEDNVILHDYVVVYDETVIKNGTEVFDHCILGRVPKSPNGTLKREIELELPPLVIGENTIIGGCVTLYKGSVIGDSNLLGDGCSIREGCSTGSKCVIGRNVSVNYNTHIGNNTKIMDNTHITGNMSIGNDVFISILVSTTNDNAIGRQQYSNEREMGPVIKDNVRIGAGANILPNITIEENAVVGAGSVVTHDVPRGKLVMGIPARVIKDA